jgi:hypothetical protein
MPVIGFIVAVVGSAVYGAMLGIGLFAIYVLRGSPGATGMEILVLPAYTLIATIAGTAAAVVSILLPRTSLRSSDNFVLLVVAAFILQALVSLLTFLMSQGYLQTNGLVWALLTSGPVDWTRTRLNWSWLYTIPLTLGICSPWFRSKFDG